MDFSRNTTAASDGSWSTVSNISAPLHEQQLQPPAIPAASSSHSSRLNARPTPLEVDGVTTASSGHSTRSWTKRIPWIRTKGSKDHTAPDSLRYTEGDAVYYPGEAEDTVTPYSPAPAFPLNRPSSFQRIASWLSRGSSQHDEQSVIDFDPAEWTPPDSSYGAAIPVGGWIPKNIRRLIEWTFIGAVISAIIFFIITTSIRLSEDLGKDKSGSKNGGSSQVSSDYGGINLDDDRYIAYHDDDKSKYYQPDDDTANDQYSKQYDDDDKDDDGGNVNDQYDAYAANDDAEQLDDQYNAAYGGGRHLRQWN